MRRILALVVIVIALVLARTQFIAVGKSLGTAIINNLGGAMNASNTNLGDQLVSLQKENASLRVALFDQSLYNPTNTVKVYSDYPLNTKKEISIAAGSNQGVKSGDIVTWGPNILIGKVTTIMGDSSVVSTIFDPSWQMAVRIGKSQIDGLLTGGNSPTVTLIPKGAQISVGDMVVTATNGYPYGLEVGVVGSISDTPNSQFSEATLQTEVSVYDLRDVTVHN